MAYVDQAKKRRIAEELKKVMPKGWKYSLGVHHHSKIVLVIRSAPVDLLRFIDDTDETQKRTYHQLNHYYPERCYSGETLTHIRAIIKALNHENYDKSDAMTDYFEVGHYVSVEIGRWDKPFKVEA